MNSDVKIRMRPRQHQEADGDSGEQLSRRKRPPCSYAHSATSYAPDLVNPVVKLANDVLWREFQTVGTEMMISSAGRRLFPPVVLSVKNLESTSMYSVHLAFTPADNQLYSYKKANRWVSVRQSNKRFIPREYQHPDGIKMGEHWMKKPVSFKMVKITNDQNASNREHLVLNSMQKYHPTVKIVCCSAENSHTVTHVYHLTEISFFAVTSYQNRKIAELKVTHNPYARGAFQETTTTEDDRQGRQDKHRAPDQTVLSSQSQSTGSTQSGGARQPRMSPLSLPLTPSSLDQPSAPSLSSSPTTSPSPSTPSLSPLAHPVTATNPQEELFEPLSVHWIDEFTLSHAAVIDSQSLDVSTSFAEPYLQQASVLRQEALQSVTSPVKPL